MNEIDSSIARWRKSSHSGGESGQCVEVASAQGAIAIRDSKDPTGPSLAIARPAFGELIARAKTGSMDHSIG